MQKQNFTALVLCSLIVFLPACAATSWPEGADNPEPVVVASPEPEIIDEPEIVVETMALPDAGVSAPPVVTIPEPPPVIKAEPELPAVVALRGQAQNKLNAGEPALAAASIERALRIQAKNPVLWLDLAEIRFAQQEFTQAENTARKALAYAGNKSGISKKAWTVIANSRYARNDKQGGLRAEAEAAKY